MLKGTDGTGGAYLKDTVYLEGNVAVWQVPELIPEGDKGKYDIANPRHTESLVRLGVISVGKR